MSAADNIVSFVRGFGERKRAARVNDQLKNYFNDPDATVKAITEIDPEKGISLQNLRVQQQQQEATMKMEKQKQYLGAVGNMTRMLTNVRDKGGDLGTAFDQLAPVMERGLGMTPDEIVGWKQRITADPSVLNALGTETDNQLRVLTPGAALAKGDKIVAQNPAQPKTVQIKRGDGGTDVLVFDPETGKFVNDAVQQTPGAGVTSTVTAGNLTLDNLRPHFVAQESGGDYKARNTETGALGAYQVMPKTGESIAKKLGLAWRPDMMQKDDPASKRYQDAIGSAAIQEAIDASGGDPATVFSYYYGGSDRKKWGPKTRQYTEEMMARVGGAPAGGGPRPAYSTPGKPEEPGYRVMTADEKKAAGVDVDTPYQISPKGEIKKIGERPAGRAGAATLGRATTQQVRTYRNSVVAMQKQVDRLLASAALDSAVGPIQGRVAGYLSKDAADFQNDTQALKDRVVINTVNQLKALSKTGATGFGALTEKEGQRLENQLGSLSITGGEEGLRRTLREIRAWTDDQLRELPDIDKIPPKHQQFLRANPATADQFDEKYGPGASAIILGK